jgi:hypothetical protein
MSDSEPEALTLEVARADGARAICSVELVQPDEQSFLFTGMGWAQRKFAGIDIFDSLILLRRALEDFGARALCAGARLDTYPSAMTRDTGGGRKVYITRMVAQAKLEDLVDIFDPAHPRQVATVMEQREFHTKWFESLARPE